MIDRIVSAEIPKKMVMVINRPDTAIRILTSMPVALLTGMANIATPTPNHPTCVPPKSMEGSQEPFIPNE
ncbi:Uncharacterised protein [Enterobacter cloacae]|nr:Uncharacterised protein [Enterobacter cloacae]